MAEPNPFKTMTPAQKLDVAMALYDSARELKAAYLRSLHSGWSEDQVQAAVRENFLYVRDESL